MEVGPVEAPDEEAVPVGLVALAMLSSTIRGLLMYQLSVVELIGWVVLGRVYLLTPRTMITIWVRMRSHTLCAAYAPKTKSKETTS